jgi:hypothetical protein
VLPLNCSSLLPRTLLQVFRFCIENSIEEKVIEKAYKKLRLDALVIQQGRLTENQGSKVSCSSVQSCACLPITAALRMCCLWRVPQQCCAVCGDTVQVGGLARSEHRF